MLSSAFRRWLHYPSQTLSRNRRGSLRVKPGGLRRAAGFRPRLEMLEDRTVLSPPGTLDPSFGVGGIVTTDFKLSDETSLNDFAGLHPVALQTDGKIVVAGTSVTAAGADFALARYNVGVMGQTDGSLDTTFGTNGQVLTDIGSGNNQANAVALQTDGKIVVAGFTLSGGLNHFALARYNPDGSLDTTFGPNGEVVTDFGTGGSQANAVAVQADGKIVAAGFATGPGGANEFALARYNPTDGSLDTTFNPMGNTPGEVTTLIGLGGDLANAIAIQSDHKIVVAGTARVSDTDFDFALARYNVGVVGQPDGSLDSNFGTGGIVTTDFTSGSARDQANDVIVQPDGQIVAAGFTQGSTVPGGSEFALARYNVGVAGQPDGSLDTTFGTGGEVTTAFAPSFDRANGVALQADGKIVAVGSASNSAVEFAMAQYNTDGSLDTSFNATGTTPGEVTTVIGGSDDEAFGAAIEPPPLGSTQSRIVVAGYAFITADYDFAVTRYSGETIAAPTASVSGPASGIVGQPLTFTLDASSPSPADNTAGFTYTVNWGDGTAGSPDIQIVPATANNGVGTPVSHTYSAIGTYTVQVTATDASGTTSAPVTQIVSIFYNLVGFFEPVSLGQPFKVGRTIPLKFQLTDFAGNLITTLSPVMVLSALAVDANGNPLPGAVPVPLTPAGGSRLRFDGSQYVFTWKTAGLAPGFYEILLTLNTSVPVTAPPTQFTVLLVTSSGSAAQPAGGTGSTTTTAGVLLAGDLEVYIDDANGLFSADELARIQDAVNAVDAVVEPFGVAVTETTDSTAANLVVDAGSTSAAGSYSDGVLGCYTSAGEITLIQGWNWYAGADGSAIGANQYDFQTTVTHELGHALGLGESSDPTSVMSGTLATGTVIRTLTQADLNLRATETGASAQSAVVPASVPLLPRQALAAANPAPEVLMPVVSLSSAGTIPPVAVPGTPSIAPAIRVESGGGDNGAELADEAELVPLPSAADSDTPVLSAPPRPAEGRGLGEGKDLAWWRATCTAYFADDSARNAPESHKSSLLPPASAPWPTADDASATLDPAAAAAALAVVSGGYWRAPAKFVDRGKKEFPDT